MPSISSDFSRPQANMPDGFRTAVLSAAVRSIAARSECMKKG